MGKYNPEEEFNIQTTLRMIESLRQKGDGEGVLAEICRPWPGMDDDMRLAVQELMAELLHNGKVPLFMKDLSFDDEAETITVEMPDWFQAANQAFIQRYSDPDEASLRFQKTMATLQYRLMLSPGLPESGYEELLVVLKDWLPNWPADISTRTH